VKSASVIVLNLNGKHLLEECLRGLKEQTHPDFETIVVDNASTDGSAEYLAREHPGVKLVRLAENRGFAGGNAQGLKSAEGRYVALLNNDAVPDAGWLAELTGAMEADRTVGICASRVVLYHRPEIMDSAGEDCVTSGHGVRRGSGEPAARHAEKRHVFGACAAAALYRREMIDEIGFLDRDFFFNCEDTDLNFRAQLAGWKCLYVPSAVVRHRVGATLAGMRDLAVYHSSRNGEFVWVKNMPAPLMLRFLHHKLIQEAASLAYHCVARGGLRPYLRGKLDALKALHGLMRKRREVQAHRKATTGQIRSVLTPIFGTRLVSAKLRQMICFRKRT